MVALVSLILLFKVSSINCTCSDTVTFNRLLLLYKKKSILQVGMLMSNSVYFPADVVRFVSDFVSSLLSVIQSASNLLVASDLFPSFVAHCFHAIHIFYALFLLSLRCD
jgi:hypothetical protein